MFSSLKSKYKIILVAGICLVLAGCSAPKGMVQAVNIQPEKGLTITDLKYSETFKEGKVDLLELNFTFPQIENPKENAFIDEINKTYTKALETQKAKGTSENYAAAKDNYTFAKDNAEGSFIMNGYQINYTVTTNDGNRLSVFQMFSEFTGGAHPFTYFKSQNYDLKNKKILKLNEVMGLSEAETKQKVLEQIYPIIEKQQTEEGIIYYETYKSDCDKAFNSEHFYLKDGKVIFYYQAYDIAPYAAGLREFEIGIN